MTFGPITWKGSLDVFLHREAFGARLEDGEAEGAVAQVTLEVGQAVALSVRFGREYQAWGDLGLICI